jgi:hypothetical protein
MGFIQPIHADFWTRQIITNVRGQEISIINKKNYRMTLFNISVAQYKEV